MWHAMCIGPQSTHLHARFSRIASESLWSTSVASRLRLLTSVLLRWTSHGRTLESQASGNVWSGEALIDLRSQISSSQCCHCGHPLHMTACPPRKRTLLHYLLHKPNRSPSWKSIIEKFRVRNAVLTFLHEIHAKRSLWQHLLVKHFGTTYWFGQLEIGQGILSRIQRTMAQFVKLLLLYKFVPKVRNSFFETNSGNPRFW